MMYTDILVNGARQEVTLSVNSRITAITLSAVRLLSQTGLRFIPQSACAVVADGVVVGTAVLDATGTLRVEDVPASHRVDITITVKAPSDCALEQIV